MTASRDPSPAPEGPADPLAALGPDVLSFAPVPARQRRDGWTPGCQRRFILALRDSGQVAVAARAVGRTVQTAYRLRKRAGAAGFAAAWDRALDEGRAMTALGGTEGYE